jgi:hypothetical protein
MSTIASAQGPATGIPPFSSIGGGPFDAINLGNLNVHLDVPIFHRAGRGVPFDYDLSYDSSVWYVSSGAWQPVNTNFGWRGVTEAQTGYVTYTGGGLQNCGDGTQGRTYRGWNYHDPSGAGHSFSIIVTTCDNGTDEMRQTASDGSGYTMDASAGIQQPSVKIYPPGGGTIVPPLQSPNGSGSVTDRNGNQLTTTYSAGVTTFVDTLGTTALTVTPSGSSMLYQYPGPSGAVHMTVKYSTKTVETFFHAQCPTVTDYPPTSQQLITEIDLADGTTKYTFTYEAAGDPSHPTNVTGRIATVTLPTGGTINYTYTDSSGNQQINCTDGSTTYLNRTLNPGGTWNYSRAQVSGSHWKTTVKDAASPQDVTIIDFQGIYETQRVVNQGASTLLSTSITCYDATTTPSNCPTTAVSSLLRRRVYTYLPNAAGRQAETDISYNSFGLPTSISNYDFGNAAVGGLLKQTAIQYASLGNNISSMPSQVQISDGGGIKSQTNYTYDEDLSTLVGSGASQLQPVNGSRGNVTTIATQTSATASLYRSFTHYDTGMLNTSTDVSTSSGSHGATTTYGYGTSTTSCDFAFPTSISGPLLPAVSLGWDCDGALQNSFTDANGKTVGTTYTDANYWRPSSFTDQASNVTTFSYPTFTQSESTLSFNSVVHPSKLDTRGRVKS